MAVSSNNRYKSLAEARKAIDDLKSYGVPIPAQMQRDYDEWVEENKKQKKAFNQYPFYTYLKNKVGYSAELEKCIKDTVKNLLDDVSNPTDPGLLLGKIQSGKTRAFVGVMGLCFDKGFDVSVIFTKNANLLSVQTVQRMKDDFGGALEDSKKHVQGLTDLNVYDVIDLKGEINEYKLTHNKIILVCKKQADNLKYLLKLFENPTYKAIFDKKQVLFIDDEADFSGHSFQKEKNGDVSMLVITEAINKIRQKVSNARFLHVTATPYSLYLQPDESLRLSSGQVVMAAKPRFTSLVPIHSGYIGGKQYFEESSDPNSMFHDVFYCITPKCMDVMVRSNQKYINNPYSKNIADLRYAVLAYFMATAIRKIQKDRYRSSCLVHVNTSKEIQDWEYELIESQINSLTDSFCTGPLQASDVALFDEIYDSFKQSNKNGQMEGVTAKMPKPASVMDTLRDLLYQKDYALKIVNSEHDVKKMVNESGQLKLDQSANIFVGGGILDRGITVDNLLAFFYGRSPYTKQQDTVLQHSRMYGNRSRNDMAVTRFYTTQELYMTMKKINEMDEELREWVSDPTHTTTFLGSDSANHIIPCAANKILLSETVTLRPGRRYLPIGFQTLGNTKIKNVVDNIDGILSKYTKRDSNGFFEMDKKDAITLLEAISDTFFNDKKSNQSIYADALKWDVDEAIALLDYCTQHTNGKLYGLQRIRNDKQGVRRHRANGGFVDAPDDGRTDTAPSRAKATDRPVLMFIKEPGRKDQGWHDAPFYWPVLMTQQNLQSAIYNKS